MGRRRGHGDAGGLVLRTGKTTMSIRVSIEEVIGETSTVLHLDMQDVPEGMRRERAVRFMLAEAMEKFTELENTIYPYDGSR